MKEYKHISLLEAFNQDFDDMEENERATARDIIDDDYDDAIINDVLDDMDLDDLDDEYWEFPDVYTVLDYYEDDGSEDSYQFDTEEEANAKFDELKAKYGPENNLHTLYLSHGEEDLRKYNPQYGIVDEYKDPTITECAKANSIDEAVAIMNEGDDDVECCRCHEMFAKCDCCKCDEGYVCNECGGKEMNEGCCDPDPESSVEPSKDVPVKDCPVNDVITHCKEENPDCEMKKKPLEKPLTESADRQALEADLKNSEEFKANWIKEVNKLDGIIDTFTSDGSDRVLILSKYRDEWCCYSDSPWGEREEVEWTANTDEEAFDELFDCCGDEFLQKMHDKYCSGNGIKESVDSEEGGMDEWIKTEHPRGIGYEFIRALRFGEDEIYCAVWFDKSKNKFVASVENYHGSEDNNAEDPKGHTDYDDYSYNTMEEFMNSDDIPDEFREYIEDEYAEYAEELRLEREAEADDDDDDDVFDLFDEGIDIEDDDGSVTIISDDILNQMDVRDEEADNWIKANNKKLGESSAEEYISRIRQGMSSLEK